MPAKRLKTEASSAADIGPRVLRLRKMRHVTQVQLAAHLGVSQPNVSLYEKGTLRIPTDLLLKITRFLQVSADELLGLSPLPTVPPVKDQRFLRRLPQIDLLPKRDRDAILRLINSCLKGNHISPVR